MDWTAVEAEKDSAKAYWIAVQFDEVMGEACAERATAWTGQRSR
jgi:hypothetical protein